MALHLWMLDCVHHTPEKVSIKYKLFDGDDDMPLKLPLVGVGRTTYFAD